MTPEMIQEYVGSIQKDLEDVEWTETTPRDIPAFKEHGAKTFSGTGLDWFHNLVIFQNGAVESCEGSAVNIRSPLIVRYTPTIAQQALKMIKDGGQRGGTEEAT